MAYDRFDPNQLSVVFGVSPISGFAEDTMITIENDNPKYNYNNDIHGNVTRYRVNKNTAKITLILTQDSKSNNILSNYVELDRINDAGVFPVMLKDPSGSTIFSCEYASIQSEPKIEFGQDAKNREWVIHASNITQYIGS